MDKKVLEEYIDACALVEETEQELKRLIKAEDKSAVVQDSVTGSMNEFPYAPTKFHLEGKNYSLLQGMERRRMEHILEERKANAEKIKVKVEEWLNTIPVRMQRIIKYKFFEGDTWETVAIRMGRGCTENGLKKEFERFMKNN